MKRTGSIYFVRVAVVVCSITRAREVVALKYSLFANDDRYDNQLKRDRLCDIGDGYIYKEGENIPTFETRCGPTDEFPCKCAPDLDPPISCSFCGFPATNSRGNHERLQMSTSKDFFCLKDGETSDPFMGSDASAGLQRCSCSVDGIVPVSTCGAANSLRHPSDSSEETTVVRNPPLADAIVKETSPSNEEDVNKWAVVNEVEEEESVESELPFNNVPSTDDRDIEDDVCTLRSGTGVLKKFQRGESFGDFLKSDCADPSKFACKCNPDLDNQMECRHCIFQSEHGKAVCALNGHKVSFLVPGSSAHDVETCTCNIPDDPKASIVQECTITSLDTVAHERDSHHYYAFGKEDWSKSRVSRPSEPTEWLTITVEPPVRPTSAPTPDTSSGVDRSRVLKRSMICLMLGQLLITIL